jgi:diguanylate cyclase (GGDEF)-like protein
MLALARIDVDEFMAINDEQGQRHGDGVLAGLANLLRGGRAADRAFRLSGDDFALLLPQMTQAEAAAAAERLRHEAQRHLGGVTISIGVAALAAGQDDADLLAAEATAALQEAKRRGRNTVVAYEEVQSSVALTSSAQAQAVRRLLAERRMSVALQPIWDLERGEILAFEALCRPVAGHGLSGPQEAFDIAERMGRAHDLDAACREAILARAAELPADTLLFMNVSPQTLDHNLLAGTALVEAVVAAGLAPDRVVLELTERSMARLDVVVQEATRLRALGFKLALDDAGAGNAGLEVLSQLPVDYLKIDRSVVANALVNRPARAVLAGIIAIARETNAYVIAEGIETTALLDLVRQFGEQGSAAGRGVQGVQGYLLGRPDVRLPIEPMLRQHVALLRGTAEWSGEGPAVRTPSATGGHGHANAHPAAHVEHRAGGAARPAASAGMFA